MEMPKMLRDKEKQGAAKGGLLDGTTGLFAGAAGGSLAGLVPIMDDILEGENGAVMAVVLILGLFLIASVFGYLRARLDR